MARAEGSPVEWLSLVEPSGSFLSMRVLERVFPQGRPPKDRDVAADLRIAYGEYVSRIGTDDKTSYHTAWILFVLSGVLGYPDEVSRAARLCLRT